MDSNPYAAPQSELETHAATPASLERAKASRGQRFGAAFLDGIFSTICLAPWTYSMKSGGMTRSAALLGFGLLVVLCIINLVLLSKNGQTLGKKIVGTKVVMADGSPAPLWRIVVLRWLPLTAVSMIPKVGIAVALVDACVIFASERRCGHDYVAGTIVVDA
ncbi:RDD family protein [Luteibacter sp. dw_328]|uniref:RDD family protein n=1 Tax=Luteibacter sp. dw_328 TaxID=2719796 RepID=UPI001BD514BB|nr:RDD family protein [Luteibacter sp. dw_328]